MSERTRKTPTVYLGIGFGMDPNEDGLLRHVIEIVQNMVLQVTRLSLPEPELFPLTRQEIRVNAIASMREAALVLLPCAFPIISNVSEARRVQYAEAFAEEMNAAIILKSERSHHVHDEHELSSATIGEKIDFGIRWLIPADEFPIVGGDADENLIRLITEAVQPHIPESTVRTEGQELLSFRSESDLIRKVATQIVRSVSSARPKIVLSSTWSDLEHLRNKIHILTRELGYDDSLMFDRNMVAADAKIESLALVRQCTAYLGILYISYGEIQKDGKSLTETEYDYSREIGRPRAFLIQDPIQNLPTKLAAIYNSQSDEQRDKLKKLKNHVASLEPVFYFKNLVEDPLWGVLELMDFLMRPGLDAVTASPPHFPKRYIAHPYALIEDSSITLRKQAFATLETWSSKPARPGLMLVRALGGMGKSALAWKWFQQTLLQGRGAYMWWSFYAPDANTRQFIVKIFEWITGKTPNSQQVPIRKLIDQIVAQLEASATSTTIVLDGLERELKFYREARLAKEYEGPELEKRIDNYVREAAIKTGRSFESIYRALMCFDDDTGTLEDEPWRSDLGYFLDQISELNHVKILATSRLLPTNLADRVCADRGSGSKVYAEMQLGGLSREEVRLLWKDLNLDWQDERLPMELGGFSLSELCVDILQGYALPIVLLAHQLSSSSVQSLAQWKSGLEAPWLRAEDWRNMSGTDVTGSEYVSSLILLEAYRSLSERERTVFGWILERSEPANINYLSHRRRESNQEIIPSQRVLKSTLDALREKRIVGRNMQYVAYEVHPRVRSAAKLYDPDSTSTCEVRRHELLREWQNNIASHDVDNPFVEMHVVSRMLDEIEEFVVSGAYRTALSLYRENIEPILRYRTTGNVTLQREIALRRLQTSLLVTMELKLRFATVDQRDEIRSAFRDPQFELLAYHLDNEFIRGNSSSETTVFAGGSDHPCSDEEALYWMKLSYLFASQCQWEKSFRYAVGAYTYCFRHIPFWNSTWIRCQLANLFTGMRQFALATTILNELHGDADSEHAKLELAFATDRDLPIQFAKFENSVEGLALGQASCLIERLRLLIRCRGKRHEVIAAVKVATDFAELHGFGLYTISAELLLIEFEIANRRPRFALHQLERLWEEGAFRSWTSLVVRWHLLKARALSKLRETDLAAVSFREAFRLADWESPLCALRAEFARFKLLARRFGIELPDALLDRETVQNLQLGSETRRQTQGLPPGITDVKGWSDEKIQNKLDSVKRSLRYSEGPTRGNEWWNAFEKENRHRIGLVLRLAEELKLRRSSISAFYKAWESSSTDNIQAVLHYADYNRRRNQLKRRALDDLDYPWPGAYRSLLLSWVQESENWSEEEQGQKTWETFDAICSPEDENKKVSELRWLRRLQEQMNPAILLRLLQELKVRKAMISEYEAAELLTGLTDPIAVLFYYDYLKLKREAQRKKEEQDGKEVWQKLDDDQMREKAVGDSPGEFRHPWN